MEIPGVIETDELKQARELDALQKYVAGLRDEAVRARQTSGIETIWFEDEEYYAGVDELNRSTETYLKSMAPQGGLTSSGAFTDPNKCTAFFNITQQFVDAARARMRDILLPVNDWNFQIRPTPKPELDHAPLDQVTEDIEKEKQTEAARRVHNAERRIKDWLTESMYPTEFGKVLDDAALLGTGILKGPYPHMKRTRKLTDGVLSICEEIAPQSKHISCWDFFPDPNCGDNIHNGSYVFERVYLTARQLRTFLGAPGYIAGNVLKVIKEGPGKIYEKDTRQQASDNDRFELWYFYGELTLKELSLLDEDCVCPSDEKALLAVPVVIAMVNSTIIKAHISPLASGEFPFDVLVWQTRSGSPFGVGVARQGRTAQRMVLSACRALMDNMGLSSMPMIALLKSALLPEDGTWDLYPGKKWIVRESSGVTDARMAIQPIIIPSLQIELMNIRALGIQMMEDATGVVSLLRGEQGASSATVGGMQLLHQNASAVLRRIARIVDDTLTKPHIRRYYKDWILMRGDPEEQGDVNIEATGATSLIERDTQAVQLPQLLEMSLNPAFGKSPVKVFNEILRAWKFDPGKFEMDEKEQQNLEMQLQQQAPAPSVQAAQIRAEADLQREHMRQETALLRIGTDVDRDTVHVQAQEQRTAAQQQYRLEKMAIEERLALLKYANDREISLERAKVELAKAAMKINSVRELVAMEARAEHLPRPPIEPPGRAVPGESWQE